MENSCDPARATHAVILSTVSGSLRNWKIGIWSSLQQLRNGLSASQMDGICHHKQVTLNPGSLQIMFKHFTTAWKTPHSTIQIARELFPTSYQVAKGFKGSWQDISDQGPSFVIAMNGSPKSSQIPTRRLQHQYTKMEKLNWIRSI